MADLHDLSGDLIAELAERAPSEGGNSGHWPGLTIYRFTSPVGPTWEEIQSLSLCIVAQGRKAVMVADRVYEYDPFNYLVLGSHLTFQAEILEAHANKPFHSFVLQIDPAVVRRVSADMLDRHATMFRRSDPARGEHQTFVSALDSDLLGAAGPFPASDQQRQRSPCASADLPPGDGLPRSAARAVLTVAERGRVRGCE
jgi:hypothetical protein